MVLTLVALVAAGCGGDDEPAASTPPTVPELTVPETDEAPPAPEPEPQPEPTTPAPTETAPPPNTDGGTAAPEPEPAPPPDTPDNDTPPPADTPAERFEDFCDDNPGACG